MSFFKIAKKSLGQNFLIDQNIINKIIKIGKIAENKTVLEIGPGYGNLTKKIANMKPEKILAIEKDKKLALFLKNIFKDFKNIQSKVLLQIHDELIFEVPNIELKKVSTIIKEEMTSVVNSNLHSFSIPLTVDINSGNNWGMLH